MNKNFRDGENKAYATLVQRLWDSGCISSFDSPERVLRCLLEPERVNEVLETFVKPVEPPSEDGWYLVKVKAPNGEEERKLYYCHHYVQGSDPWWKGFLCYGDTPVKHGVGINENEKVVGWSKISSGDRVDLFISKGSSNISQDVIDRLSTPYSLSAGWIKSSNIPQEDGEYLTLFWDDDYADINVYNFVEGTGWFNWDDEPTELVDYWRPLPHLPEEDQ